MSADFALQTHHLKKHFGNFQAVEDISLSVKRGDIFGFLGPNGAGKTTTISMILGLVHPTAGEVEIFGQRVTVGQNQALQRVGTLASTPALILPFSARQNLHIMAHLRPELPVSRIEETLKLVGLQNAADRPTQHYSQGMKQRLGLAIALLNKPELLILDEPTNGLDASGMHEMRLLLQNLAQQGVTIFLSSHLLYEMQMLCNRVAVVRRGRTVTEGDVSTLLSQQEVVHVTISDSKRAAEVLALLPRVRVVRQDVDSVEIQGASSKDALLQLIKYDLIPMEVMVKRPDLERVFLELTETPEAPEAAA